MWIDPHTGNNYFLTVQYRDGQIETLDSAFRHCAIDVRVVPELRH